ncbi:hypothetical protein [Streptomyces sp. NPDC002587]
MAREVDLETFAAAWGAGVDVVDVWEPEDRLAVAGMHALAVAGGTRGRVDSGRPVVTGSAPGSV